MNTSSVTLPKFQGNKVIPILEKNYGNNLDSDYTEKIEELDKNFNYSSNSHAYWSEPEHSLLYGTPLYEKASETQKLALNHLHWIIFYKGVADSEIEVINYNTITADCLMAENNDYEMLVKLLANESFQERKHIHAFYQINYLTIKALLGKKALINSGAEKFSHQEKNISVFSDIFSVVNSISNIMLKGREKYQSQNFREWNKEGKIAPSTQGFFNGFSGKPTKSFQELLPLNWGSYPFLAANFYAVRYMANLALKNNEFPIHNYFKKLQKTQEFIPIPTAISHYHFLDEAFHTTTSLFLGRNFYKTLPKPSIYEKVMANLAVLQAQRNNLIALSGIVPNRFYNDGEAISFLMKLFQSPVFDMSAKEAIFWIEKCLCHEHEGFHINLKSHARLLSDLRKFAEQLDYLWPVNREMRVMASGGSLNKAIKENTKAFNKFING